MYLWLYQVFIAACRLSLVAVSWGYSLTTVCGFLIVVVCLVVGSGAQASVAVAHGLRCSAAYAVFLDWGLNQCLLF